MTLEQRSRLFLVVLSLLAAPGCAHYTRNRVFLTKAPPARELTDDEKHEKLERDLSLYSD